MVKHNRVFTSLLVLLFSAPVCAQQADPTEPPSRALLSAAPAQVELRSMRLTSIWYRASYRDGDSVAIINGSRVKQGEKIGDYRVVRIEPDQVTLENDDGEISLRVFRSDNLSIEKN